YYDLIDVTGDPAAADVLEFMNWIGEAIERHAEKAGSKAERVAVGLLGATEDLEYLDPAAQAMLSCGLHFLRGKLLNDKVKKMAEAIAAYEEALKAASRCPAENHSPRFVEIWILTRQELGNVYMREKRFADAWKTFRAGFLDIQSVAGND